MVLFAALLPLYISERVWSSLNGSPLAVALLIPSDGTSNLNLILMATITLGAVQIGDLIYDMWVLSKMVSRKLWITYVGREWVVRGLISTQAWLTSCMLLLAMNSACCPDRAIVISYISSMSGKITIYGTGMLIVADYVQSLFVTDTNTNSSINNISTTNPFPANSGRQFSIAWRIGVCCFFTLLYTLGQIFRLLAEVVPGARNNLFQAVIVVEFASCVVLFFYLFIHSMKIMYSKIYLRGIVTVGAPPTVSPLTFKELRLLTYTIGYMIYYLISFAKFVVNRNKYYNSSVSDLIQWAAADLILTIGDAYPTCYSNPFIYFPLCFPS